MKIGRSSVRARGSSKKNGLDRGEIRPMSQPQESLAHGWPTPWNQSWKCEPKPCDSGRSISAAAVVAAGAPVAAVNGAVVADDVVVAEAGPTGAGPLSTGPASSGAAARTTGP